MAKRNTKGTDKLVARITEWFKAHPKDSYNYLQISQELGIFGRSNRTDVYDLLVELQHQGFLREVSPGRYGLADRQTQAELIGVFERRHNGMHIVRIEGNDVPFVVYDGDDMQALTGDKVRIQKILGHRTRIGGPQARVVEVIERVKHRYVGVLQKTSKYAFVTPDNRSLDKDIYIPNELLGKAHNGDKVVVDFERWPAFSKNPVGRIADVLGKEGENNTEMHAILAEYGLPYKYPENVVKAAERIQDGCTPEEIAKRLDYRQVTTFTIDPADAKDFDDALSIKKLKNGIWEVGVHIADVTFYVHPDSIINKEAYNRATSIYLVDRTIPMLPEKLCNNLCSLRPGEDKLCFSVIFEMDDDANVLRHEIVRTVTRSDRRFNYEEAQEIIETGKGDFAPEMLQLDRLAKQLRARRFAEGAIGFEREEVKFVLDEKGKPTDVYFKVSKDANKLIEEFMLLANRTVAEAIGKDVRPQRINGKMQKKAKSFVYRIHDQPSQEKLESLATLAARFGHNVKSIFSGKKSDVVDHSKNKQISQGINQLMKEIHNRPEENMLSTLAIRTQAKAVYSTENIGHYGLAFDFYTHFTSPIRRYPDCMVHRLLDRYLFQKGRSMVREMLEEECKHCSEMEQLAVQAERSSIKYKQAEFLQDRMGQVFEGVISGVSEWGIYVELKENLCEGLISVRDLRDDHYIYDERNFCLIGRRTHRRVTLGDTLKVTVANVNLDRKTIDFALVEKTR